MRFLVALAAENRDGAGGAKDVLQMKRNAVIGINRHRLAAADKQFNK